MSCNVIKELIYSTIPYKEKLGYSMIKHFIHRPCFIVGCGRSGTTALALALDCHPELKFSNNEAPFGKYISACAYEYKYGNVSNWYQENIQLSG